ncbi:hypothetical protein [Flavobacterium humi]|uniref:DUF3575 domain-containing protein n=1 Tax=Flavobacterium humi TaxID=2562683 RepID=A0A4Z0L5L7_9FLAO|nr:hypothetical protein [Flavobacterium humi]TGD57536.1 hypothetical protein E4635_10105 [Flavobacterium humi]
MKKNFCLLLLFAFGTSFYGQNKTEKSKNELSSSSSKPAATNSRSSNSGSDSDVDTEVLVDVFVNIGLGVFKYGLIGDYNQEDHLYNSLSRYPFYKEQSGNYNNSDSIAEKKVFRLDFEDKFLYSNNDLFGNHMNLKIRPFQYFYLQADFRQIAEINRIDDTNNGLSLFHFNFCYDRVRMGKFDLGWSLGASYVGNEVKKGGFSYGLSASYFMTKNFSFSGSAKWSAINQQPVNAFEIEGKLHKKKCFFTAGFEHLKIATPTYNFISLGGGIYL